MDQALTKGSTRYDRVSILDSRLKRIQCEKRCAERRRRLTWRRKKRAPWGCSEAPRTLHCASRCFSIESVTSTGVEYMYPAVLTGCVAYTSPYCKRASCMNMCRVPPASRSQPPALRTPKFCRPVRDPAGRLWLPTADVGGRMLPVGVWRLIR